MTDEVGVTRHKNLFREEIVLTDKQKLRKELVDNKDKMKEKIKSMTPLDIFILFDEDDSGLISFEEFRKMLPYLDINISDAKALRYFRMCDTDGSGEIDIDEFNVAIFTCDPTSGNPIGFKPSTLLTPMDVFELFDEDESGYLDEDEYYFAMEYIKVGASDFQLERLFFDKDYTNLGRVDYEEFRDIFIEVCDVRKELEERGVEFPSIMRDSTLKKMLRDVFIEEENKERRALAEAKRYKKWIMNIRDSKKILKNAEHRAVRELRSSLDAAGHVYVIGSGNNNQFQSTPYNNFDTSKFKFEFFEKILELWRDRVQPQQLVDRLNVDRRAQDQEDSRDSDRPMSEFAKKIHEVASKKSIIDPYLEAKDSPFHNINISLNTATLWGRRIHQVSISESVIFALADTGEIFTWGGNSYWWHEIQPDSIYQSKWRGDTTPRSQLLLNTKDKPLPPENSAGKSGNLFESSELTGNDKKIEMVKNVAKYFNVWSPPNNPSLRLLHIDKDILPKIEYDNLVFSLKIRGKDGINSTKLELIEIFYEDILLEKKLLGERSHKAIRELELEVGQLIRKRKFKQSEKYLKRIQDLWEPLREVQIENDLLRINKKIASEHEATIKSNENYSEWRMRVLNKRQDINSQFTPRNTSLNINLIGSTPRGPAIVTPRGYEVAIQISAGSAHACLVHKTGQLYSWGVGASGRLGLDMTNAGDPQKDASKPTLVQALSEVNVIRVSCGYSHTAAIVLGGDLFTWGSTVNGKCGLGEIVQKEECYSSIPVRVIIGSEDRRARKVSCGSSHTGVITESGHLFMFGCGDGGRLGLGEGNYASRYTPVLVKSLLNEKVSSISCGNVHTLISTEITKVWVGDMEEKTRKLSGGKLYVAGSRTVLGQQYDAFTHIPIGDEGNEAIIKQVSAGFSHSVVVSSDGEVFCWGNNKTGCCGQPEINHFIDEPTPLPFLYTRPSNLALKKKAYQSSTFNNREAKYAVNGKTDGNGAHKCTSTQLESQPWIEIDLGANAVVDKIVIWNRTDTPSDKNQPTDYYSSRLFPCWIMLGLEPFPLEANMVSLKEALKKSSFKARFVDNKRVSTYRCPHNAQGRYVRLQLENYNTLSVAQIEVFGQWGVTSGLGKCSYAVASRDVTVTVIRPSTDPTSIEIAYRRAIYADSLNADILKQFETYALEYDKHGRGDVLVTTKRCDICKNNDKCETCSMYEIFEKDIEKMPPAIGNRRRNLNSITDFLINSNLPALEEIIVPKCIRSSKWKLKMDALRRKLPLSHLLWPIKNSTISSEEALSTNPDEMYRNLNFTQNFNQNNNDDDNIENYIRQNNENDYETLTNDDLTYRSSLYDGESLVNGDMMEGSLNSETKTLTNSIGTIQYHNKPVRHGYNSENVPYKSGDILPTGHLVKLAYPKSLATKLQEGIARDEEQFNKKKNKKPRSKKLNRLLPPIS